MTPAPIVLFAYNRPHYLLKTLESLAENLLAQSSTLIIYLDGLRSGATEGDIEKVQATRTIAKSKKWCSKVIIVERMHNLGLARSISSGVTEIVQKYGRVIVLEDDLLLSPYFLQYMNDGLDVYERDDNVLGIGACNFFTRNKAVPETFFIPIPDCWGWATWANRWELFEPDAKKLLEQLQEKALLPAFNLNGVYDFESMLRAQIAGQGNSWAIRWQAVAYLTNKLTLYPKYALTDHIGLDAGATNSYGANHLKYVQFPSSPIVVRPERVKVESAIFDTMLQTYREMYGSSEPQKKMDLRYVLKKLTPPAVLDLFRYLNRSPGNTEITLAPARIDTAKAGHLYWEGNYSTWEAALAKSDGYDAPLILNQVKEAVLKVKNGEAVYERDSVLFDKIQYSWPLLAILLKIASENDGRLSVLDFGGSLGSSYFQNRSFLSGLKQLEWSIVEQESFVACGKESVAGEELQFFYTIEDCLKYRTPDVLLLSGVLQCLDAPYQWLEQFLGHSFPNLVLDRTAFIGAPDRLTVQHVPESIYEASYPAWFLNKEKVIAAISAKYDFVADFDNGFTPPYTLEDGAVGCWNGLLFTLKK